MGAVGSFTPTGYFYALGLGAQMVSLKFNFLHAVLQGHVYHFPTSHYVNPLRCASRSFDCYFEPPTNCTAHARKKEAKIHWCFDLPRRRLSRLAGLHTVHPKEWYHAQVAAFLFRPNRELRTIGRELLANMEASGPAPAGPRAGGRVAGDAASNSSGSCAALHIRRTDKHTEDHRTAQRSFADFAQLFKSWTYWRHRGPIGAMRAFLGSEDPATFRSMPPLLAPFDAYWIPSRYFVMDMQIKATRFFDIKQGNSRLGELYGLLEDRAGAIRKQATSAERAALMKDEGQILIAQILLMSGCEALIASYSSNVAILVHDLMLARRISRGEEMHAMDVNGRVYCGCGASFCMQLERKLVRDSSGRSAKHVIDTFKY